MVSSSKKILVLRRSRDRQRMDTTTILCFFGRARNEPIETHKTIDITSNMICASLLIGPCQPQNKIIIDRSD